MMPLLGIAGAGFLITLLLSRWVPYAVVAVVLGGVVATFISVAAFNYTVNDFYPAPPQGQGVQVISIFAVMVLAFMGAIVARWAFDRRAAQLVKTDLSATAHTVA